VSQGSKRTSRREKTERREVDLKGIAVSQEEVLNVVAGASEVVLVEMREVVSEVLLAEENVEVSAEVTEAVEASVEEIAEEEDSEVAIAVVEDLEVVTEVAAVSEAEIVNLSEEEKEEALKGALEEVVLKEVRRDSKKIDLPPH